MTCGGSAAVVRRRSAGGLVPHTPPTQPPPHRRTQARKSTQRCSAIAAKRKAAAKAPLPHLGDIPHRMNLEIDDIVPGKEVQRKVGWDMRHHFMAEKIIDRYGLKLPCDRELIRQLAVIYVLKGLRAPPDENT